MFSSLKPHLKLIDVEAGSNHLLSSRSIMTATETSTHLAVLIDGDNVSPKVIGDLLPFLATYGTASVRRIYGDWTSPNMNGWKACLLECSIQPIQQFAYTTGKNATDGAMIIDAMELLYTGRFSGFCIVSSDSDFTRLAARIREQGVAVYGFGERKTVPAFRNACTSFVYFDALPVSRREPEKSYSIPQTSLVTSRMGPSPYESTREHVPIGFPKRPLDQAALEGLERAIINSMGDDNYANLANVGAYLRKISPDLNARNYGYDRLRDFVEASGIVHLKLKQVGDNPPIALVCLKEKTGKKTMSY